MIGLHLVPRFLYFLLILLYLSLYLTKQPFITSDLPRHLTNGRLIIQNHTIPSTNIYSYTHPDYPTIMHHWGSGVIFYLVQHIFGFIQLHIFSILINLLSFQFLFHFTSKYSHQSTALFTSLVALPLIATRTEIRPEIFSILFIISFFFILWQHLNTRRIQLLYLLPILQIIWTNLHVFFVFGPILISLFFFGELSFSDKSLAKHLFITFFATLVSGIINPWGVRGLTSPLALFNHSQNHVIENASILQFSQHFTISPYLLLITSLTINVFLLQSLKYKLKHTFYPLLLITLFFGFISFVILRTIVIYGFLTIFITSHLLHQWLSTFKSTTRLGFHHRLYTLSLVFILFLLIYQINFGLSDSRFGLGLYPGVNRAGEYINTHNLPGPILNNFNSGSYLIYHLTPRPVFIDNRSEAYPNSFFALYQILEKSPKRWSQLDQQYHFNLIFVERLSIKPEWHQFISDRIHDPDWVEIYQDNYAQIFLRRTPQNLPLINQII